MNKIALISKLVQWSYH